MYVREVSLILVVVENYKGAMLPCGKRLRIASAVKRAHFGFFNLPTSLEILPSGQNDKSEGHDDKLDCLERSGTPSPNYQLK
jgi:hypothetical protein